MRIVALLLLAAALLGGCAINGNTEAQAQCAAGAGGQIQVRIFDSGGIEVQNMTSHSILSDEGFECWRVTGPYETHMNVRDVWAGNAPSSIFLLGEDGRPMARALIYRTENPRYQGRTTYGNVEVTFFEEGFRYDYSDGLPRTTRCLRTVRAQMPDGSWETLCAYDWFQ